MLLEHQIRILEPFLKDRVILKTGVMALGKFSFANTRINYNLCIKISKKHLF